MIPVTRAPPPAEFETLVRQKGLDAIAELVGEAPSRPRPGRRRKVVAATRAQIPAEAFPPYWRDVLPHMLESYGRLCAYLALYIEPATGSPSVDHVVPKSKAWDRVYEWSNYRLACALVNARKNDLDLVLDPFSISANLFAMELVQFQIVPGPAAAGPVVQQVKETIETLGLNMPECCEARKAYVEAYELGPGQGGIDLVYLQRRAPFVAQELRRQNGLQRGDN